jgi:hypothetical protein
MDFKNRIQPLLSACTTLKKLKSVKKLREIAHEINVKHGSMVIDPTLKRRQLCEKLACIYSLGDIVDSFIHYYPPKALICDKDHIEHTEVSANKFNYDTATRKWIEKHVELPDGSVLCPRSFTWMRSVLMSHLKELEGIRIDIPRPNISQSITLAKSSFKEPTFFSKGAHYFEQQLEKNNGGKRSGMFSAANIAKFLKNEQYVPIYILKKKDILFRAHDSFVLNDTVPTYWAQNTELLCNIDNHGVSSNILMATCKKTLKLLDLADVAKHYNTKKDTSRDCWRNLLRNYSDKNEDIEGLYSRVANELGLEGWTSTVHKDRIETKRTLLGTTIFRHENGSSFWEAREFLILRSRSSLDLVSVLHYTDEKTPLSVRKLCKYRILIYRLFWTWQRILKGNKRKIITQAMKDNGIPPDLFNDGSYDENYVVLR